MIRTIILAGIFSVISTVAYAGSGIVYNAEFWANYEKLVNPNSSSSSTSYDDSVSSDHPPTPDNITTDGYNADDPDDGNWYGDPTTIQVDVSDRPGYYVVVDPSGAQQAVTDGFSHFEPGPNGTYNDIYE